MKGMSARMCVVSAMVLLAFAMQSCRKDRPEPPVEEPNAPVDRGVYVVNEGNFQWGNASVSHYDASTGEVVEDLYAPANGEALGDVLQSMTLHDGKAYLVVNNSGKVEVVDPATFVSSATITGLASPRYLLPVSSSKAYVSDLQSGSIAVVDLQANSIAGSIPCAGWTEMMALVGSEVFVTNQTRRYVYVIDTATDAIVDSIAVSRGGNSLVVDAQGALWVACGGGSGTPPALYRIDPSTRAVEAALFFPSATDSPWRLTTNGDGTALYYLNTDVFRLAITDDALPSAPFVAADGRNFYGLGVDPVSGVVHAADALDFAQRGVVHRYGADGASLGSFFAGRIPSAFIFH